MVLVSLLGVMYLLVFYQPGNNPSYDYFVAVAYPFQVRLTLMLNKNIILLFSTKKNLYLDQVRFSFFPQMTNIQCRLFFLSIHETLPIPSHINHALGE